MCAGTDETITMLTYPHLSVVYHFDGDEIQFFKAQNTTRGDAIKQLEAAIGASDEDGSEYYIDTVLVSNSDIGTATDSHGHIVRIYFMVGVQDSPDITLGHAGNFDHIDVYVHELEEDGSQGIPIVEIEDIPFKSTAEAIAKDLALRYSCEYEFCTDGE